MPKLHLYLAGAALIAGGAVLGRWVDPTAGLAVGGAGMWLIGRAQKEWGRSHRKRTRVDEIDAKTPPPVPPPVAK